MDFQDAVKERNKAISDMISGHFPISTFSEELAVAASNLLKNIHDKGIFLHRGLEAHGLHVTPVLGNHIMEILVMYYTYTCQFSKIQLLT